MGELFFNFCDKTIKLKHKKKNLNTKSHMDLSDCIMNKKCFKNPELIEMEKIIRKRGNIYNKRFEFLPYYM